ncbi:MAG: ATP-binding protein [Desulfobacterales bacterium]|nr:ATP-binding protein [Desulfobacterales bacterium]
MSRLSIIFAVVLLSLPTTISAQISPEARDGIIDLSAWHPSSDGPVALTGTWEFYWQTHLPPENRIRHPKRDAFIRTPGVWNKTDVRGEPIPGQGFATYRLIVELPPAVDDIGIDLGLKFLDMATSFRVFVNGIEIAAAGEPGLTIGQTTPAYTPRVSPLPHALLTPKTELLIHVSNFHHWQGGMWEKITLGSIDDLTRRREHKLFMNALLFGSILIMGLYHLILYRLRPQDKSTLYFGLFCLMVAVRPLTHGERPLMALLPETIPFTQFLQLNYISFYFCVPLFAYYTRTLFPEQVSRTVIRCIALAGILAAATTLIFPPAVFTGFMPWFQWATMGAVAYGAVCVTHAVRLKRRDALIFVSGFLLFALTILNDILYTRQVITTIHLVPLGLFTFILCQAFLLSRRFSRAFHLVTRHRRELETEIKHRRRVEADLIESEFRFRQMAEFLPLPLIETDKTLHILYANRAALKWFGYTEEQMSTGRHLSELFKEDVSHYFNPLAPEILGHKEMTLCRSDGSLIWAMVETARIMVKNETLGLRICFVDLAERKKAETAALHAAEQSKYALVGQVAGKMAHDFNNILSAIMGNTELTLMDCTDAETRENLNIILEQTKRGHILTQNLVAFARDQDPRKECFNLNRKIESVMVMLGKDLDPIRLNAKFDENLPDIMADPGMIEQCLINLFQNAIHALSRTGAPEITLVTRLSKGMFEIELSDNGCGIPESSHSDIYTPSFTLKGSRDVLGAYAPGIKGTGYGLANVKKYMDKHGGGIAFTSVPDQGSTFTLSLPADAEHSCQLPEGDDGTTISGATGQHILLVEDESAIAVVFRAILTKPPFDNTVILADTGRMAMDLFEPGRFDLVSLDYMLPGKINGLDVYHHIRSMDTAVPVVFVSGNMEFAASIQDMIKEDPALGYLPKPCDNLTYAKAIEKWLNRK